MSGLTDIIVVARWQTTPERLRDVLDIAAEVRRQSLAELGCLSYEIFRATDAPGSILLLERYRDEAALEAHRTSAHYRVLVVDRILPMLTGRRVELLRAREAV